MEKVCKFTAMLPTQKSEGWKTPAQRELFINLFKIPFIADNFWLAGGTCLSAMYLGHRYSEDLDIFTTRETIHPNEVEKITNVLRAKFDFDMPTVIHDTFTSMVINDIKVEFVSDMFAYRVARPEVVLDNTICKVDRWDNLCVAKFSAFLSRTSEKDISDIGAILKTAKDKAEQKEMINFLTCETRKRDSMADELTKVYEIVSYASNMTEDFSYRGVLSESAKIIKEFEKEISEKVESK
ncbi:MAG: nucleotidyl transferase AbiEii/AbiGii toxin family protein [Synergistaceae bacterium]|nr:nucleotidyl transferase AbiEii/AbiGii toxin family protein [Synergistaceae bacterium]